MAIDIAAGEAHLREVNSVRKQIAAYFATPDSSSAKWREMILLADSIYQGRRFECAAGSAVWSPEEGTIAIVRDGQVVECLSVQVEAEAAVSESLARAA